MKEIYLKLMAIPDLAVIKNLSAYLNRLANNQSPLCKLITAARLLNRLPGRSLHHYPVAKIIKLTIQKLGYGIGYLRVSCN